MGRLLSLIVVLFFSHIALADSQQEINHLLDYVEKTDCIYQRNGVDHSGVEARAHIQKKYDYYRKKIDTAEAFIRYSATKSAMSGKKYTISCPDKTTQYSGDWLNAELNRYREQAIVK